SLPCFSGQLSGVDRKSLQSRGAEKRERVSERARAWGCPSSAVCSLLCLRHRERWIEGELDSERRILYLPLNSQYFPAFSPSRFPPYPFTYSLFFFNAVIYFPLLSTSFIFSY
ncbi:hypothetical protein COCON_G00036270, partial [Conger conger]